MIINLISFIVKNIAEKPDVVNVKKISDKDLSFAVHVDESDRGKILGKNGSVVKSIQNIIYTVNHISVKIVVE